MLIHYRATGMTTGNEPITGVVVLDSETKLTDTEVRFNIRSFVFMTAAETLQMAAGDVACLVFYNPPGGEVIPSGADASFGPWTNNGTGVVFRFADGTNYPTSCPRAFYESPPAAMWICTDLMSGGPFQPQDGLILTWDGLSGERANRSRTTPA